MSPQVIQGITFFLAIVISLSIHEASHALVAFLRGDNTAKSLGRLSLNPLVHVDIMGTVIFPIILFITSGYMFGWAKPVPVNIRKLKNERIDHLLVSLAGPASNLILCFFSVAAVVVYGLHFTEVMPKGSFFYPFIDLLRALILINAILAMFNLIPLPPLDGASVIRSLLPATLAEKFDEYLAPYGFFILIMLMISGGLSWVSTFATAYIAMVFGLVNSLVL